MFYISRWWLKGLLCCILVCSAALKTFATEIIVSIKPLQLITLALIDASDTVQVLIPDGASPHTYHYKPSDLRKLAKADLVIWLGPSLESALPTSLRRIKAHLSLMEALNAIKIHSEDEGVSELPLGPISSDNSHEHSHLHHEEEDPHIWLSPQLTSLAAQEITRKLIQLNPASEKTYVNKLMRFQRDLEHMRAEITQKLDPVKERGFVSMHDAYLHFAEAFDLNYIGYIVSSPETGYSASHIAQLRSILMKEKGACVMREPQLNPKALTGVLHGLQIREGIWDPLGMNVAVTETDYFKFLSSFAESLKQCLS